MGKIAPDTYQKMFASSNTEQIANIINSYKKHFQTEITKINGKQVSLADVKNKLNSHHQQMVTLNQMLQNAQDKGAVNLITALLLALVVTMILETFMGPELNLDTEHRFKQIQKKYIPSSQGRLVTVRYALIAGCLAVLLARPRMLGESTLILALIVTIVVLTAGLIPLNHENKNTLD